MNETLLLGGNTVKCAQILKVVLDFDKLLYLGSSPHEAYRQIANHQDWYDSTILEIIERLIDEKVEEYRTEKIRVEDLRLGMIVAEDLCYTDGEDLIEEGQELNPFLLARLKDYAEKGFISSEILVKTPIERKFEHSFSLITGDTKCRPQGRRKCFKFWSPNLSIRQKVSSLNISSGPLISPQSPGFMKEMVTS